MFNLKKIDEFRTEVMGAKKPETPALPSRQSMLECLALIDEERGELARAVAAGDLVEIADAVADLIVVVTQLSFRAGIDIDAVLSEVHRSNMTKVGGAFNEAGKFIKPETYEPADVVGTLKKQGWKP